MQKSRGGRGQGQRSRKERDGENRIGKDAGRDTEMTRRTRDNQTEILWIRNNVAHNPIGTLPNAPLDYTPGKELHTPILSTLEIYIGQFKRERDRERFLIPGEADKGDEQGGCGCPDLRSDLLGGGPVGHAVWVRGVGHDPPHWEGVGRIPPQGVLKADWEEN